MAISTTDLYLFSKWRTNWNGVDAFAAGPTDWNFKSWRWWHTPAFDYDLKTGFGSNNDNTDNPVLYYEGPNVGSNFDGWSPAHAGIPKNSWLPEEYEVHQSGAGTSDGFTRVYQFGRQIANYTGMTRQGGQSGYNTFFAQQYERMNPQSSWRHYYDVVYVDDSFWRLMLSNASSWSLASTRGLEVQIPTLSQTGRVEFLLRKGALTENLLYLYWVNSSRVAKRLGQVVFP